MERYGVRLSVCLSVRLSHLSTAAAACGGFAAVGPAGRRYRSPCRTALQQREQRHVVSKAGFKYVEALGRIIII